MLQTPNASEDRASQTLPRVIPGVRPSTSDLMLLLSGCVHSPLAYVNAYTNVANAKCLRGPSVADAPSSYSGRATFNIRSDAPSFGLRSFPACLRKRIYQCCKRQMPQRTERRRRSLELFRACDLQHPI